MRTFTGGLAALILSVGLGCATGGGSSSGGGSTYMIKGVQIEGCECDTFCPCIFSKDATSMDCRGTMGWLIQEGHYKSTDLKGVMFGAALTHSGRNIEKTMGKWEGILYLPQSATEEQRKGLEAIMKDGMGGAFAKLEIKTAPVEIKCPSEDHHEVTIGKVADLKITGIKGASGKVAAVDNAPSPIALPRTYCAKADVNTYNDGMTKWDFAGHNGYYGPFEMKSK